MTSSANHHFSANGLEKVALAKLTFFVLLICLAQAPIPRHMPIQPKRRAKLETEAPSNAALKIKHLEVTDCHNVFLIEDNYFSGSQPESEAAYAALARLGIKLIVNVDGAHSMVEAAAKHGIRTVHLPIGYDKVPHDRAEQYARLISDYGSGVYFHCHHGRHRGPAALTTGLRVLGKVNKSQGLELLKVAGTSPHYQGLYHSVESATLAPKSRLSQIQTNFSSRAKVSDLISSMADLGHRIEIVAKHQKSGWSGNGAPLARTESLNILENLKEQLRLGDYESAPDFQRMLTDSKNAAESLYSAFSDKNATAKLRSKKLKILKKSCKACHIEYRDN